MAGTKTPRQEFYLTLYGKVRADETMFVTCPQVPGYSAVVNKNDDDGWTCAVKLLTKYLEKNIDASFKLRLIPEGKEDMLKQIGKPSTERPTSRTAPQREPAHLPLPAAHVIGAMTRAHAAL